MLGALIAGGVCAARQCSGEGSQGQGGSASAATAPVAVEAEPMGDPLLAEARARIEGGHLPEDLVQALLASDAAAHRRARRILTAMRGVDEPDEEQEATAGAVPLVPPKIEGTPGSEVAPVPAAKDGGHEASVGAVAPAKATRQDRPRSGRASLSAINLREHARGATLTLHASGGIVVGVANQPRSGIVRLVVESSGAAPKVLGARPRVAGARVTEVRAGTNTVIVTLELDSGWSLGTIERTSSGARIHLRRPG